MLNEYKHSNYTLCVPVEDGTGSYILFNMLSGSLAVFNSETYARFVNYELTEKEMLWAGMLEDVLKQNDIPFFTKQILGAGLALKIGPMSERCRFYVPYSHFQEADELVESLFAPVLEQDNGEEATPDE